MKCDLAETQHEETGTGYWQLHRPLRVRSETAASEGVSDHLARRGLCVQGVYFFEWATYQRMGGL